MQDEAGLYIDSNKALNALFCFVSLIQVAGCLLLTI